MKKLITYAAIAVTMFALLSVPQLNAQVCTKEQKAVWQEVENMWANWKAGDMDAAFANVSKDYQGWSNNSPMPMSYTKWVNGMKESKDQYSDRDYNIEPARIVVHGDAAVVHSYYDYSYVYHTGEGSQKGGGKGRWTEFFVKENGKWMLIGDFTYEPPQK